MAATGASMDNRIRLVTTGLASIICGVNYQRVPVTHVPSVDASSCPVRHTI